MNCNVIKDLLPLYIDKCCSNESSTAVDEHLAKCDECKALFESMSSFSISDETRSCEPKSFSRINNWKASLMQSILFFVSFAIITIGVALEAYTPSGFANGFWALSIVIPATGFMLSLSNWYFVRLYKSRKAFSKYSCILTLLITLCAYIWAAFHYELIFALPAGTTIIDVLEIGVAFFYFYGVGFILTAICCLISKALSNEYAKLLGKE